MEIAYNNSINDPRLLVEILAKNLRDNLYNMSDHLPIVMNLETNKQIILSNKDFSASPSIKLENTLVKEKLKIHLNSNISEKITFEVYNILGQKLMNYTSENLEYISIDVSQLTNGIYYLKTYLLASRTFKFTKTS